MGLIKVHKKKGEIKGLMKGVRVVRGQDSSENELYVHIDSCMIHV